MIERPTHEVPNTHMTTEDANDLIRILTMMPSNTGFMISHCIEPPHTLGVHGGYSAIVMLPGTNARGDANENNPARALLKAWARAHMEAGEKLTPKGLEA